MVKIISIASGKGGVGKTVATANIGTALASHYGKKTVVVDCNLTNPHLSLYLGGISSWPATLNDVLQKNAGMDEVIYEHSTGLKIIPASFDSRDLRRMSMYRLRSKIKDAFKGYEADIVILDSAPGLSSESLLTMRAADEVLFVATPHIPAVIDITKTCQLLKNDDAKPIGILMNRVKNHSYELGEKEITKFTDLPVIASVPESDIILKSTNFKTPAVKMKPNDKASRGFLHAAGVLIDEKYMPSTGFLSRIMQKLGR